MAGFIDMVKMLVKEGKELFAEVINEELERPQFYTQVELLISEIKALDHNKNLRRDPDVQAALFAAFALRTSLKSALETFDEQTKAVHKITGSGEMPASKYYKALHDFCEHSLQAINKHQSALMAAPGLWNKIKEFINNILEEYLDIKEALGKVQESKLVSVGLFKSRFNNTKAVGKATLEEIEKNPLIPNI